MGTTIHYRRPDGQSCGGYYAGPPLARGTRAVVVIQEWWGLNNQIKGVAQRLAHAGYRALVPDLYRGRVTVEAAEAEHLMGQLDFKAAATQDVQGAVNYFKADSVKVAVTGFCMGGALTILAAALVQGLDAAVSWYGFPPVEAADTRTIRIPLLGHFAEEDEYFPVTGVDALEQRLQEGHVPYELHRYRAQHAFANEERPSYDRALAELAWERTLGFLATHLA